MTCDVEEMELLPGVSKITLLALIHPFGSEQKKNYFAHRNAKMSLVSAGGLPAPLGKKE